MGQLPKILIIENSIYLTGALKSAIRTAVDLKEYFEFVFVLPKGSKCRRWIESESCFVIYELPMIELSRRPASIFLYLPYLLINAFRIRQIIRSQNIRLIHVNDLYNLLPVSIKCLGCNRPYVCHIRFLPEKFPKVLFQGWLALHLHWAAKIIVVSHLLKKQLPSNDKIVVVHNELPVKERHPYLVEKHKHPTLLYLSNIIRGKGQQYAILAFAEISKKFPDWRLRFVGSDMGLEKNLMFKKELIKLCLTMNVFDKVEWGDFTDDVELEYKRAEIALNFSESESFSMTCLEALFFGCPLIATDSGGPAEIINHGITGFLVPKNDIYSMVKAMNMLISDKGIRSRFSTHGRQWVRDRFSIDKTTYVIKGLYFETIGKK